MVLHVLLSGFKNSLPGSYDLISGLKIRLPLPYDPPIVIEFFPGACY